MNIETIYEDNDIIAVNKPAGINVHPDDAHKNGSVIQIITDKFPEIKNIGENPLRPGVVHRLDRDTSGVLIFAKNQKTFEYLKNIFKAREIKKTYIALLIGKLGSKIGEKGIINLPLARSAKNPILRSAAGKTRGELKSAITEYKILKYFNLPEINESAGKLKEEQYTLVEAYPKTGRTHQIRAHFKALGHPVAGDKLYSRIKKTQSFAEKNLNRHFLHAASLEFTLPSGGRIKLEADMPEELRIFLEKINTS